MELNFSKNTSSIPANNNETKVLKLINWKDYTNIMNQINTGKMIDPFIIDKAFKAALAVGNFGVKPSNLNNVPVKKILKFKYW